MGLDLHIKASTPRLLGPPQQINTIRRIFSSSPGMVMMLGLRRAATEDRWMSFRLEAIAPRQASWANDDVYWSHLSENFFFSGKQSKEGDESLRAEERLYRADVNLIVQGCLACR